MGRPMIAGNWKIHTTVPDAYIGEKEIDGVLAGGASLKPEEFVNIAHQMAGQSK